MSRNKYVTTTAIAAGLPTSHGISNDDLTAIAERASEWVDSQLADTLWVPFPAIGGTPPTPAAVHELAMMYAHWYASLQLAPSHRNADDNMLDRLRSRIDSELKKLQGPRPITRIPVVEVVDEVVTWGVYDDDTLDDWFLLACGQKDVQAESVSLASADGLTVYRNYWDFGVDYSPQYRNWYLIRKDADIPDGVKVSYNYSYYKRREQDVPRPASGTIVLS